MFVRLCVIDALDERQLEHSLAVQQTVNDYMVIESSLLEI
jgi:hypothetical protein